MRIENGKLYAALCERLPGNKKTLDELRKAFRQGATSLHLTDYWVAQLLYNLYAALYTHVGKMTTPVFNAIGVLINEMGGATLKENPQEFAAAIEKFRAETLPALVAADATIAPPVKK